MNEVPPPHGPAAVPCRCSWQCLLLLLAAPPHFIDHATPLVTRCGDRSGAETKAATPEGGIKRRGSEPSRVDRTKTIGHRRQEKLPRLLVVLFLVALLLQACVQCSAADPRSDQTQIAADTRP